MAAKTASPTFARWLREQLANRGWSATQLATELGVRPPTVYHWTGGTRTPLPSIVGQIARLFEVAPSLIWDQLATDGIVQVGSAPPAHGERAPSPPLPTRGDYPFAAWLESELLRRGWTAGYLARRLGVDPSTTRNWLHGRTLPAEALQLVLAGLLDLDPGRLRQEIERPAPRG